MSALAPALVGILFVLLYVLPASLRLGRPFLIAASIALLTLILFWASAYIGPIAMEDPRGLGAAIDLFLRIVATAYFVMACAVQGLRYLAKSSGYTGYRHWPAVVLGAIVPPVLLVPFV